MKTISKITLVIVGLIFISFISSDTDSQYRVPNNAYVIATGDFDLDGNMDLVMGHWLDSQTLWSGISILNNNGYGLFNLTDSIYLFANEVWVFAKDINNDGYPDIIGDDGDNDDVYGAILLNNNGNYLYSHFILGSKVSNIALGDINGDNFWDITFISNNNKYWGVIYNDKLGGFSSPVHYNLGFIPFDITTGDLDGNGRDDIVIASEYPRIEFSFSSGFTTQQLTGMFDQVHIADMNKDGIKDIIGVRNFNTSTIYIYDGSLNFSCYPQTLLPFEAYESVVSDLDNDSLPDIILVPVTNDGLYIRYNTGNDSVGTPVFISVPNDGETHRNICCADLDGNGFADIAMVRCYGPNANTFNNVIILYNDGQGNFGPNPINSVPTGLYNQNIRLRIYPNPFQDRTNFCVTLPNPSMVNLSIYNSEGFKVKELINGILNKGQHSVSWEFNQQLNRINPGVYIANLKISGKSEYSIKIIKY